MSPQLNVRNAQVSTATVEIKTLTLSGKQVTLAVFRQLIEAPLIKSDGNLNGVAWGTVNYHWGECKDDAPHWHCVWQLGDELRRSQVSMTHKPEPVLWSESLAHLHAASVYQWLTAGQPGPGSIFDLFQVDTDHRWHWVNDYLPREFPGEHGIKAWYQVPEEVKTALRAQSGLSSVRQTQENMNRNAAKAEQDLDKAREDLTAATSRGGFRRPKAPESHRQDCTCTDCVRSNPAKAADRVRKAEEFLAGMSKQASEYSSDSVRVQQAEATLHAALKQLHDRSYSA
jgi:hypothetical protein